MSLGYHNPKPSAGDGDQGTVAVITAILAVVLFAMAAFAVELTDAYSRDRAAQTVADLAAYGGAQDLPNTCAAMRSTFANLDANAYAPEQGLTTFRNDDTNIRDDEGRKASFEQLNDGSLANGEIQVFARFPPAESPSGPLPLTRGGDWLDTTSCNGGGSLGTGGRYVRVLTPPAQRNLAFARLIGQESITLQASASVGLTGAQGRGARTLPVFLPSGCATGPLAEVGTGPRPYPIDFNPSRDPGQVPVVEFITGAGGVVIADPVYDETDFASGSLTVRFRVSNLGTNPATGPVVIDAFYNVGYGQVREPPLPSTGITTSRVAGTTVGPNGGRWTADYLVTFGSGVTGRPGEWSVRAGQFADATVVPAADARWGDVKPMVIAGSITDTGLCDDPVSGDFGIINSPREGVSGNALRLNVALGLDHGLAAFDAGTYAGATSAVVCGSDESPTGAFLDIKNPDGSTRDGANCLAIASGLSGGAGPMTDGLITGPPSSSIPGRLELAPFSPPSGAPPTCKNPAPGGAWDWKTPVSGNHRIVNTVLSCYLTQGSELHHVFAGRPNSLDPAIYQDPRFFFVPVLSGDSRPGSMGNQYAIIGFKGAFITSETFVGRDTYVAPQTCTPGGDFCNGIRFGNTKQGKQVFAITTFVFPPTALPTQLVQSGNGDTFIDGSKDFLLVE